MKQYSERWDAYYDSNTNEWLDSKCDDPTCEYCVNRPEKPMNENIKAGADLHAGDGGYSIGTQEKYEEFARRRMNQLQYSYFVICSCVLLLKLKLKVWCIENERTNSSTSRTVWLRI